MTESETFRNLVDRGAFLSKEKQIHLEETLAGHTRWDADLGTGTLTLAFSEDTMVCDAQVLGSSAPGPGTWLWAWANDAIAGRGTTLAQSLREFGERHGIPEFMTAEIPLGEAKNDPPEAFWYRLATAVTSLAPEWNGYFPATLGGGTKAPLVIRQSSLTLPQPSVARVARALGEAISDIRINRHSSALAAYVDQRGIPTEWAKLSCTMTLPDGALDVRFDGLHRIVDISGHASGVPVRTE